MNRKRSITLKKLAEMAGVSQTAVSLILNGRWREARIAPALATRVRALAKRNYYRPNKLVHAMQSGRTQTLVLIVPFVEGEYFPRIAIGIEREAKRHGYHLLISHVEKGIEDEAGEIEALLERRVDGLIVVPRYAAANRENYRRLIAQGIPLVFVDGYYPDVPCPAVVAANEEGMFAVTRHLIALGHRRIAYHDFGASLEMTHMQDRRRGFLRAMAEHGLKNLGACISGNDMDLAAVTTTALKLKPRPTALVTLTDYNAATVLGAVEAMGLRVPDDVAVTGFSDCLENVNLYRVPLTTVRVDLDAMGKLAMQQMLRELEKVSNRHELTQVPATLIVRASSGGLID